MNESEKAWEEHLKVCMSCKRMGKWNNKGGTTEEYHAFICGFRAGKNKILNTENSEIKQGEDFSKHGFGSG